MHMFSTRKPGFTLIELLLAMSIFIIMTAIAIPSFNMMNQGNSWSSGMQSISTCISVAQRQAVAPSLANSDDPMPRFTAAILTLTNNQLNCQDFSYADVNGVPPTLDDPGTGTPFGTVVTATGVQSTNNTYRLYFSVAEAGKLVKVDGNEVVAQVDTTLSISSLTSSRTSFIFSRFGTPVTVTNN